MTTSLYDMSVASYLQVVGGFASVLQKAEDHFKENSMDTGAVMQTRLREDMLPFQFQVISVMHHSLGAIKGIQEGVFTPPPSMPDLDFAGSQALVADTISQLQSLDREAVDGLAGKAVTFKLSSMEIPFVAENFVLSFSLPNLYFHATTAYDILRIAGVQIGKMDYLGKMRAGGPAAGTVT